MPAPTKTPLTLLAEYDEAVATYEAACEEDEAGASDEAHDAYLDTMLGLIPDMAAALRGVVGYQSSTTTYSPKAPGDDDA